MSTEDFHRKLTAILSADVVGYSKLMGDDESATVKTLETYKAVMFSLIRQHRGRVVDSPGDNLLADFGSVVDAVQCGVSIQKELQTRNADLPENRRMEFRIGINLGDVIEEEDRIYGDGVNIAARLEGLADPGGICISKTAFLQIESKLPLNYEFLGDQTVKNIAKPVGAYKVLMETRVVDAKTKREATVVSFWRKKSVLSLGIIVILAIAVALYWKFYPREPSIEPDRAPAAVDVEEAPKTIAVLPFENLSSDPEQEYFVDGLSEELLNTLAQIPALSVTSRTSSFYFKGTNKKLREIASELGVAHILEGSVRKDGNALRITAQLIRAEDDRHLWSETYDRELKNIFEVQENIATAVANELKLTLGIGKSLKQLGGTDNVEAYELYLASLGQQRSKESLRALEMVDAAIRLDPEFAAAWATKSFFHTESIKADVEHHESKLNAALDAANRAIELEPNLAAGYLSLGWIKTLTADWIEAELAYGKALELTTEPFTEYSLYPLHYFAAGHLKKASEFLYAYRQKNPLDESGRGFYILSLGIMGDMQGAEEEYERCKVLFGEGTTFAWINMMLPQTDTWDSESKEKIRNFLSGFRGIEGIDFMSPENSLSALRTYYNEVKNPTTWGLVWVSFLAAYFGDPEFALEALEKEIETRSVDFIYAWLPIMHEVRQLPRFKEFVREIGLVDYWEQFGWPDICRPLDNEDFECD